MKKNTIKIKSIQHITHDVLQIVTEKPTHFKFIPGQATELSINKEGLKKEKNRLPSQAFPDSEFLEFTIKTYPSHKGFTNEILKLKINDELILHDVFGTIVYKGEGVFIAGGAGITPFINIFRNLQSKNEIGNNVLIFANKKKEDIILDQEFKKILGKKFINILSDEKLDEYAYGQITEDFLKTYINESTKNVYICAPPPMMEAIEKQLIHLKIEQSHIIKEAF